jgi:hypothetical protein
MECWRTTTTTKKKRQHCDKLQVTAPEHGKRYNTFKELPLRYTGNDPASLLVQNPS